MGWQGYNVDKTKMQFITSMRMPSLVYKATVATKKPSNSVYIQHAVCEALSRDLGIPIEELLAELPKARGADCDVFGGLRQRKTYVPGSNNNTNEDVR